MGAWIVCCGQDVDSDSNVESDEDLPCRVRLEAVADNVDVDRAFLLIVKCKQLGNLNIQQVGEEQKVPQVRG
jgi:hypothetical protein